jgi:S1-C subfamily serine protease
VLAAAIAVPLTWQLVDNGDQAPSSSGSSANGGSTLPFGGSLPGGGTQGGTGGGNGGEGGGTWTVPGASTEATGTPASEKQSQGVLLVETELPNGAAAGTAMVLDSSGLALTNYHVVHGSTAIRATVASTGETYTATVVGHDEKADVALIQLKGASGLDTVKLDQDSAAVNDAVTAVGNALGQGQLLAATGKITAEDQSITTRENALDSGEALSGLIETNAPVVSGYSGGPMYDDQGEVVGISTAASSNNASGVVDQGAAESYAVPIDDAMAIVDQIEAGNESGDVQVGPSPYLGIEATQATTGVGVGTVENDGAAARAGVAAGDTITALDGTKVSSLAELRTVLGKHEPGDQVQITWTTANGSSKTATITLGDSPVN